MIALITAVVQLVFLIVKTIFEKDAEEKKRKDELLKGWDDAVKSGNTIAINDMLLKLKLRQ